MKTAFDEAEVKTAKWKRLDEYKDGDLKFPLIIKHIQRYINVFLIILKLFILIN